MALIHCPECSREVSDSAPSCPHCGFSLAEFKTQPFEKVVNPLHSKRISTAWGVFWDIFALVFALGCIIYFTRIIWLDVLLGILIGPSILLIKHATEKNYQYGKCPYCGGEIRVRVGQEIFRCPICSKIGAQTENTLESTHGNRQRQGTPNTKKNTSAECRVARIEVMNDSNKVTKVFSTGKIKDYSQTAKPPKREKESDFD